MARLRLLDRRRRRTNVESADGATAVSEADARNAALPVDDALQAGPPATASEDAGPVAPVASTPRVGEVVHFVQVPVPKPDGEPPWRLGYFSLMTLVFALATVATLSWNWSYVNRFSGLPDALRAWTPPSFPFPALIGAVLGTIQIVVLGAAAHRCLFPRWTDPWEAVAIILGLGIGLTGLVGTILALLGLFNFAWIEAVVVAVIVALVALNRLQKEPRRAWSIARAKGVLRSRPRLRPLEWMALAGVAFVAALVAYQATFYPIVETDALIYHAPLAAIVYYHGGLPWIVGGGVGLGSSANYPQLFSLMGSYYYVWTGGVHDVYLRLVGAASWGLVIYTTFLIARRLAGRSHGFLAAILAAAVPSFVSYAFLATQETTVVMFGALGFLALIKARVRNNPRHGIVSGLFLGFAALTSYQGLYLVLPLLPLLGIAIAHHRGLGVRALRHPETKLLLVVLFLAAVAGSAPYLRNWILLQDPVYPFYRSLFPSPYLSPRTMQLAELEWASVARSLATLGGTGGTFVDFLYRFGTHPSFAPLNLAFAIPAFLALPVTRIRRQRELASFYFVVLGAVLAGPVPFIRYLWLLVPFAAVALAAAALAAFQALRGGGSLGSRPEAPRVAADVLGRVPVVVLTSLFLLPVVVGFSGNEYFFGANGGTPPYFQYFKEPGIDSWRYLRDAYGSDVSGWQWFNDRLRPGERIASLEYRGYYLDRTLRAPDTMLYLDSQEAEPLYSMQDPAEMVTYLRDHRVAYVFVRVMDWTGLTSSALPLFRWLGSPYFGWAFVDGRTVIFDVGLQPYPAVPPGNPIGLYGMSGIDSPEEFAGKRVLRIPMDSLSPRVSILGGPEPRVLVVRYWDAGQGILDLNAKRSADNSWYAIDRSQKGNTSSWRTSVFVLPNFSGQSFIELGLHASGSDFIVDDIEVKEVQEPWVVGFGSEGSATFPSETQPPAIFVYLPFLLAKQRVTVTATAGGSNLSLELFRGLIQPGWRTGWWLAYPSMARNPALSPEGSANPRLDVVVAASGTYTLTIVLSSPWRADITPDVRIVIG